jgi:hypothetical protein
MTLSEISRLFNPAAWAAVIVITLAAALGMGWFVTEPGRANRRAAEAGASSEMSGARAGAAADAGAILDDTHSAETQSEALSRENADAILQAPGADQRLDPELNRTARERLCERAAYRGRPECAVQQHGGAQPPR